MSDYLFEIGTEEIPSDYIAPAVDALRDGVTKRLAELWLPTDDVALFATPRRLAVGVAGLPIERPRRRVTAYGPPAKAAFDADGNPTKAAVGFAKSKGAEVTALTRVSTDKGEYAAVEIEEGGEKVADLLAAEMEKIVLALPFPKSMVWGDGSARFTRPVRWVVSLFDGVVAPMSVAGVAAGNETRGHRFMAPASFVVTGRADYAAKLRAAFVVVDPAERRAAVLNESAAVAELNGADLYVEHDLVAMIANLTEWPVPLYGAFDERFLALPEEVIRTSLKKHQRMFTLTKGGKLTNGFIGVSNTKPNDPAVVVGGYRRVLGARLSDALFFFEEDRKKPLAEFAKKLDGVVYQKTLGSVGEKVGRVAALARFIAGKVDPKLADKAEEAARLAKADLETQMVYEFPELQGYMGRAYAKREGIDADVAEAIYESYLPRHAGDEVPATDLGAILALADKIETVVGCFSVGLVPTSAQDPFALRRMTIGVIKILHGRAIDGDVRFGFPLSDLLDRALGNLEGKRTEPTEKVTSDLAEFFAGRIRNGVPVRPDVVDAALAAGFDDIGDVYLRIDALDAFRADPSFAALSVAFKRVANITKGRAPGAVDPTLFEHPSEGALAEATAKAATTVTSHIAARAYGEALRQVATLRPAVDAFFDGVMVMTDDQRVRANRLNLLSDVASLLAPIADFSRLSAPLRD